MGVIATLSDLNSPTTIMLRDEKFVTLLSLPLPPLSLNEMYVGKLWFNPALSVQRTQERLGI